MILALCSYACAATSRHGVRGRLRSLLYVERLRQTVEVHAVECDFYRFGHPLRYGPIRSDFVTFVGGDGGRKSPEHLAMAGRNLWLLGIWLEHVLKKIPFHHRYKEFTDELTNAHVPELCLER
jgi:hypothetical protein